MSKKKKQISTTRKSIWNDLDVAAIKKAEAFCDSIPYGLAFCLGKEVAPGSWYMLLVAPDEWSFALSNELNRLLGLKGDCFPGGTKAEMSEIVQACQAVSPVNLALCLARIDRRLARTMN